MAHEHTELFEISVAEVSQDFRVDFVLTKRRFVLAEAEVSQPSPDVHSRLHSAQPDSRARGML